MPRLDASRVRHFFKTKLPAVLFVIVVAALLLPAKAYVLSTVWPHKLHFFHRLLPSGVVAEDTMRLPHVMLWAWERPEDLRAISSRKMGVAFLARTVELRSLPLRGEFAKKGTPGETWFGRDAAASPGVTLKPRMQPLRVGKEAVLMAVVRLETTNDLWHRPIDSKSDAADASAMTLYSDVQRETVVNMIVAAARLPQVKALQIDFDAARSEQLFYASLLKNVRAELPEGMPLSITALASWCISDPWLDGLPPGTIDEAVPMLFRMGPDGLEVASYVESGGEFRARACRGSVGVSTDERFSQAILSGAIATKNWSGRRIYVFSPQSWVESRAEALSAEVAKWHDD
jgi:hypothetical protein